MQPRCARLRGVLSPTPTRSLLVVGAFRIHAATQRKSQPPAASFSLVVDAARHAAPAQAVSAAKNPPYCPRLLVQASAAAKRHRAARVFLRCFLSALSTTHSLLALGRRRKTRDTQRGTSCGPCKVQPPALPAPELAASRSRALCAKNGGSRGLTPAVGQSLAAVGFQLSGRMGLVFVFWNRRSRRARSVVFQSTRGSLYWRLGRLCSQL